jgi:hypothetical protein
VSEVTAIENQWGENKSSLFLSAGRLGDVGLDTESTSMKASPDSSTGRMRINRGHFAKSGCIRGKSLGRRDVGGTVIDILTLVESIGTPILTQVKQWHSQND